ncbi:MAG: hypothetical protein Kow0069_36880 [Promethearchaeota archaeon]
MKKLNALTFLFLVTLSSLLFAFYPNAVGQLDLDDDFEENDTFATAAELEPRFTSNARELRWYYPDLYCASGDSDFYKIDARDNWRLDFTVHFTEVGVSMSLNVTYYNATTKQYVVVAYDEDVLGDLSLSLSDANETTYFLELSVKDAFTTSYSMEIVAKNLADDDMFEENDDIFTAARLNESYATYTYFYDLNADDHDFYYLEVLENHWVDVTLHYNRSLEDLDLYVFDWQGQVLGSSTNAPSPIGDSYEKVKIATNYTGKVYVAVRELFRVSNYELEVVVTPNFDSSAVQWSAWPGDNYSYVVEYSEPATLDRFGLRQRWSRVPYAWGPLDASHLNGGDPALLTHLDNATLDVVLSFNDTFHDVDSQLSFPFRVQDTWSHLSADELTSFRVRVVYNVSNPATLDQTEHRFYLENLLTGGLDLVHSESFSGDDSWVDVEFEVTGAGLFNKYVAGASENLVRLVVEVHDGVVPQLVGPERTARMSVPVEVSFDLLRFTTSWQSSLNLSVSDYSTLTSGDFTYYGVRGTSLVDGKPSSDWRVDYNNFLNDYDMTGFSSFIDSSVPFFKHHETQGALSDWAWELYLGLDQSEFYATLDANNDTHVVWSQVDWDGDSEIFYTNDVGGTFSSPTQITRNHADDSSPVVAVDSTGVVHVIWTRWDGNDYELYYLNDTLPRAVGAGTVTGFANATGQEIQLTDNDHDDVEPAVDFDSSDVLFVAWKGWGNVSYDVLLMNSTAFWTGPIKGSLVNTGRVKWIARNDSPESSPALAISPSDVVHVAWVGDLPDTEVFYANSSDAYKALTITNDAANQKDPALFIKPGSEVPHLAWLGDVDGDFDVYRSYAPPFVLRYNVSDNDVDDESVQFAYDATLDDVFLTYVSKTLNGTDWKGVDWDTEFFLFNLTGSSTTKFQTPGNVHYPAVQLVSGVKRLFWQDSVMGTYVGNEGGSYLDTRVDEAVPFSQKSLVASDESYELEFSKPGVPVNYSLAYDEWGVLEKAVLSDDEGVTFFSVDRVGRVLMPTIVNVTINQGEECTYTRTVVLHVKALGAEQMLIYGDVVSQSMWLPYLEDRTIILEDLDGVKNVRVKVRNGHRVSDAVVASISYVRVTGRGIPGYPPLVLSFTCLVAFAAVVTTHERRVRLRG